MRDFFSEPGRKFLSKVWKEYKPIRVDGIVTTVECKHCARNICAERKHGTSLLRKRLKRCKGRRKALIVSYSSGRLFHQRWPDNRPGSGPNPTPILNYYWPVQSHSSPHLFDSTQFNPIQSNPIQSNPIQSIISQYPNPLQPYLSLRVVCTLRSKGLHKHVLPLATCCYYAPQGPSQGLSQTISM
jgi:hypothetical protein